MDVLEIINCRCHVKLQCTAALCGLCWVSPQVTLPGSVIPSCMDFLWSDTGVSRINTANFFCNMLIFSSLI